MKPKNDANLSLATCVALSFVLLRPAWAVERQTLKGHIPAAAAHLQPIGRLPGVTPLNLVIALPLRNQGALSNVLEELYNPASSQYRHYMTPEQFAEKFGPAKADYEALTVFAKAHGLQVTGTHP